jgi:hypothetical protein
MELKMEPTIASVNNTNDFSCEICLEQMKNAIITDCGHSFCEVCIQGWLKTSNTCPHCRNLNPNPIPNYIARAIIEKTAAKTTSLSQTVLATPNISPSSSANDPMQLVKEPIVLSCNPPIVIRDLMQRRMYSEKDFPPKTFTTIRSIAFHEGIVRIVTDKTPLTYRISESAIQAYRDAKLSENRQAIATALDEIVLHTLFQQNQLQISAEVDKKMPPAEISGLKEYISTVLIRQTNNMDAKIIDFIEFDSFENPHKRVYVAVSIDRPKPIIPITLAMPFGDWIKQVSNEKQ